GGGEHARCARRRLWRRWVVHAGCPRLRGGARGGDSRRKRRRWMAAPTYAAAAGSTGGSVDDGRGDGLGHRGTARSLRLRRECEKPVLRRRRRGMGGREPLANADVLGF